MAMDIEHCPSTMNLLDAKGFLAAAYHATCLRPGGGMLAAPVCSTFTFMLPDKTYEHFLFIYFYAYKNVYIYIYITCVCVQM